MKKQLLVSTALVGGALIFAGPVAAAELNVGGSLDFQAGIADQDDVDLVTPDFVTDTEIEFQFSGQADNGLSYGAEIELEADQDSVGNTDEARIHMSGSWGRLELGDEDGAEDRMIYDAGMTQSGVGGIDGDIDRWYINTAFTTSFPDIIDTSDSTKVTYFTPRIQGFQAGVSYTPQIGSQGLNVAIEDTGFENHIGLGGNWEGSFEGFDVGASVVGGFASDESALDRDDIENFAAGGYVGFQGITVAGSVGINGDSSLLEDSIFYDIGVGYSQGPLSVSAGWLISSSETEGGADEDFSIIAVGAGYQIADGLYGYADLLFADSESETFGDTDGSVFLAGVVLSF